MTDAPPFRLNAPFTKPRAPVDQWADGHVTRSSMLRQPLLHVCAIVLRCRTTVRARDHNAPGSAAPATTDQSLSLDGEARSAERGDGSIRLLAGRMLIHLLPRCTRHHPIGRVPSSFGLSRSHLHESRPQ